jgi:hypothetical protein
MERLGGYSTCARAAGRRLHGRLGRLGNGLLIKLRGQIVLWGSGEILPLDLWSGRTSTVLVNGLLSLRCSLLGVALNGLGSVSGVLLGKALDLGGLLASDLTTLLKLSINDFLVLDVDKRGEVGDESGDQGQAPERHKLDEEVRDQRSEEGL